MSSCLIRLPLKAISKSWPGNIVEACCFLYLRDLCLFVIAFIASKILPYEDGSFFGVFLVIFLMKVWWRGHSMRMWDRRGWLYARLDCEINKFPVGKGTKNFIKSHGIPRSFRHPELLRTLYSILHKTGLPTSLIHTVSLARRWFGRCCLQTSTRTRPVSFCDRVPLAGPQCC